MFLMIIYCCISVSVILGGLNICVAPDNENGMISIHVVVHLGGPSVLGAEVSSHPLKFPTARTYNLLPCHVKCLWGLALSFICSSVAVVIFIQQ